MSHVYVQSNRQDSVSTPYIELLTAKVMVKIPFFWWDIGQKGCVKVGLVPLPHLQTDKCLLFKFYFKPQTWFTGKDILDIGKTFKTYFHQQNSTKMVKNVTRNFVKN